MSLLCCPACGQALSRQSGTYRCGRGHSYDIARQNYVNLLLPNRGGAQEPGDSLEMVQARVRFLGQGYYRPLADHLAAQCGALSSAPVRLLDAGCGEGTYLSAVAKQLPPGSRMVGIDLSRPALRRAGRRISGAEFAVASLFQLPLADESIDLILHVFAPTAEKEFSRVLRAGGKLLSVTPGPRHLWEMKTLLYQKPYENEEQIRPLAGFRHRDRKMVQGKIFLPCREDVAALYQMTPYAWRSPREPSQRFLALDRLETVYQFYVDLYEKITVEH